MVEIPNAVTETGSCPFINIRGEFSVFEMEVRAKAIRRAAICPSRKRKKMQMIRKMSLRYERGDEDILFMGEELLHAIRIFEKLASQCLYIGKALFIT